MIGHLMALFSIILTMKTLSRHIGILSKFYLPELCGNISNVYVPQCDARFASSESYGETACICLLFLAFTNGFCDNRDFPTFLKLEPGAC